MYLQSGDLRTDDILSLRVVNGDIADFFRRFAKSILFLAVLQVLGAISQLFHNYVIKANVFSLHATRTENT